MISYSELFTKTFPFLFPIDLEIPSAWPIGTIPILQFLLAMKALLYPTDSPSFTS